MDEVRVSSPGWKGCPCVLTKESICIDRYYFSYLHFCMCAQWRMMKKSCEKGFWITLEKMEKIKGVGLFMKSFFFWKVEAWEVWLGMLDMGEWKWYHFEVWEVYFCGQGSLRLKKFVLLILFIAYLGYEFNHDGCVVIM